MRKRFHRNIPRPSVPPEEEVPPLHPILGECDWFYDEDAGGFTVDFGKYEGRKLYELPFSYIEWFLGEFKDTPRWRPLLSAATTYKEGLYDYMEDHYGEFLVPLGKCYRGTNIRRVRNKPWLRWIMGRIRRPKLERKYSVFLQAAQLWLDHPRHQEVKRDIGERTDRRSDDDSFGEEEEDDEDEGGGFSHQFEWEADLPEKDLQDGTRHVNVGKSKEQSDDEESLGQSDDEESLGQSDDEESLGQSDDEESLGQSDDEVSQEHSGSEESAEESDNEEGDDQAESEFLDDSDVSSVAMHGSDDYDPSKDEEYDEEDSNTMSVQPDEEDEEDTESAAERDTNEHEEMDSDDGGDEIAEDDDEQEHTDSEIDSFRLSPTKSSRKIIMSEDEDVDALQTGCDSSLTDKDSEDMEDDEPLDVIQERLRTPRKNRRMHVSRSRYIHSDSSTMNDDDDYP